MKWLLAAAAFSGAFLLEFNPVFAAPPVCTPDVIATCDQLRKAPLNLSGNKELGFPASQTGAVIFNGDAYTRTYGSTESLQAANSAVVAEMEKLSNPSPAQAAQAVKLGETLRDQAKQLIVGDLLPQNYSPEQKATIARLDLLVIKVAPDEHALCWKSVPLGYPNAGYDPETNSILICPATARQSKAYLAHALSHEIGHAVSPCVTKQALFKIKGKTKEETAANLSTCGDDFLFSENSDYNGPEAKFAQTLMQLGAKSAIGYENSDILLSLESCNVLEEVSGTSIETSDVFASTSKCIEAKSAPILEATRLSIAKALADRNKTSVETELKSVPKSSDVSCSGLALEEFADSFGSKLAAASAKLNGLSKADIRSSLVLFQATACDEQATDEKFRMKSEYPAAKERIQKYLSNPDIAAILGCSPAPEAGICPMKFDSLPNKAPSTGSKKTAPSSPRAKQ